MCFNNRKCLNGATCQEDFPRHSYNCDCAPQFTGRHCESSEYRRVIETITSKAEQCSRYNLTNSVCRSNAIQGRIQGCSLDSDEPPPSEIKKYFEAILVGRGWIWWWWTVYSDMKREVGVVETCLEELSLKRICVCTGWAKKWNIFKSA